MVWLFETGVLLPQVGTFPSVVDLSRIVRVETSVGQKFPLSESIDAIESVVYPTFGINL
jgi:hypothetical protein